MEVIQRDAHAQAVNAVPEDLDCSVVDSWRSGATGIVWPPWLTPTPPLDSAVAFIRHATEDRLLLVIICAFELSRRCKGALMYAIV